MHHSPHAVSGVAKPARTTLLAGSFLFLALFIGQVHAAFVTLHEARVDEIYSQAAFGSTPVDIRYGSVMEYVAPDLLDIGNGTEFYGLLSADLGLLAKTVPLFFVDSIGWCGDPPRSYAGCADDGPGPGRYGAVIDSDKAQLVQGDELIAHEIGHVVSLMHPEDSSDMTDDLPENLMQSTIRDNITEMLVESQVDIILASQFVQEDDDGYYIDVAPILVVAAASVPLPAPALLLLSGLTPLVLRRRNRRA